MDVSEFWKLIDKTREAANWNAKHQSVLLTEELAKLPAEEIISFERIFHELKEKAYIGNLWDAATVIMQACSDSGFEEFREWLVGRGRQAYENAIRDPETLVDVLEVHEQIYPTLLGPAMEAYEKVTGKDMPPIPRPRMQLQGRTTININAEENELLAAISRRFPKLTAKFWEWWTRDKLYLEIHDMLRELLVPLGFLEMEVKAADFASFQRNQYAVRTMIDADEDGPCIVLSVSSERSKKGYPEHQQTMILDYHQYTEEKKRALYAALQNWLATIGG
jgi:hypothetical protein